MSLLFVCSNTLLYEAEVLSSCLTKDESASVSLPCPYFGGFIDGNDITIDSQMVREQLKLLMLITLALKYHTASQGRSLGMLWVSPSPNSHQQVALSAHSLAFCSSGQRASEQPQMPEGNYIQPFGACLEILTHSCCGIHVIVV